MEPIKSYDFFYHGHTKFKNQPKKSVHYYSFKNRKKTRYIVIIEEFENELFILKFHTKNSSQSSKKYNILTNQGDARRVIFTCIKIGLEIYQNNPFASFGFLGSPTIKEMSGENKLTNTKRLRVYKRFATFFFDPENFEHHFGDEISFCLIYNKKSLSNNPNLKATIISMLDTYYDYESFFE